MPEEEQGVEAPTIQLNPEISYEEPELQQLKEQQYPSSVEPEESQEDTLNSGTLTSVEDPVEPVEEAPEKQEVKEPKAPEKEEEKKEEEPSVEDLNVQAATAVKEDLPEPFHPYIEEFYKNDGKLSKESLAKIKEDHGYDESMVEVFIKTTASNYELKAEAAKTQQEAAASKAEQDAQQLISELHQQVGGEEDWNAMVEWAATEAPKEVVDDYNELIEHSDPKVVRMAVKTLHQSYKDSQPQEPKYIKNTEGTRPAPSIRPYASDAEQHKDFADPRYNVDRVYTDKVQKRVEATLRKQGVMS